MRWSVPYRHSTFLHQRVACQTFFHDGYSLSRCHLRVHAYVALYGTATSALPNPSHPSSFHIPFLHLLGVLVFTTFLVCYRPPNFGEDVLPNPNWEDIFVGVWDMFFIKGEFLYWRLYTIPCL